MTQYIIKNALVAEIQERIKTYNKGYANGDDRKAEALEVLLHDIDTLEVKEDKLEIDEKHKIGKWFTGLIPCWVDAPSTLQAAHDHHGKNIVAIHLKDGGYRCCCVDDKEPITFSLPENTSLVEGWHNRKYSCDEKAEEKAKAYDEAYKKVAIRFGSNVADEIFPELKESKDERIKREILELVSIAGNGNQFEEIKDWLEKQGK